MNSKQLPTERSYQPENKFGSGPALGWTVLVVFVGLTTLGIILRLGNTLALAFPAGAVIVGILLFFRCPTMYVSYMWWLWFIVPLIRRLSDYTGGYVEPSPFLLAPFFVTAITGITLGQSLLKMIRRGSFPFILVFVSLLYALLVGIVQGFGPVSIVKSLLGWITPPLLGFHLFANWRDYPSYRDITIKTFLWAVLLMGSYGIFQYLFAPEWDLFWLTKSGFTSAGRPEPMGFRIWSTLNSPGPFGNLMKSCLLVLFSARGSLLAPSLVVGYLSFLLSMIRSAWGGWFVGVLVLMASLKSKHQMQLILTLVIFGAVIFSLANLESFSAISDRVDSLSNLENDGSANIRLRTFGLLVGPALTSLVGKGIGDRHYDWGIFIFLFNLGWIGTAFYVSGLFMLVFKLFEGNDARQDKFIASARAVVLSTIIQLPFGSVVINGAGVMLWSMVGLGVAARQYYREKRLNPTVTVDRYGELATKPSSA